MSDNPKMAFPTLGDNGMTLRDYFAAKAMQSLVIDTMPNKCAELAYQYADAMLKAREAACAPKP